MIFPVLLFCKGTIAQPRSLYINLNVPLNFLLSLSSQNLLSISSISLISIPAAFTHTWDFGISEASLTLPVLTCPSLNQLSPKESRALPVGSNCMLQEFLLQRSLYCARTTHSLLLLTHYLKAKSKLEGFMHRYGPPLIQNVFNKDLLNENCNRYLLWTECFIPPKFIMLKP